jgi:DNA primase
MSSAAEQIKARLSITDVVQSYIKIQKAGANFKACCPFHNEKSPSFIVSPARDSWHCFGCSKGGDSISFVMEIEGVEFPEALQMLATRAGIELKHEDPRLVSERSRLLKLMETATLFYETQLKNEPRAAEYLAGRGLKSETIKDFQIGYAPDEWEAVVAHLQGCKFTNAEIEKSGLAIPSERTGKIYDRFRGRAMFPISDAAGRVVGFSGRILPFATKTQKADTEPAKYINSPQTLLYDKSRVLFGFDKAKTFIRQADSCILVEGQMDVVMSHQAGVKNAVAVSGTALTPYHLTMIKRLADKVVTAFDMDPAGGMATKRGVDLALREGFEVRVAVVRGGPMTPDGIRVNKDPADLVRDDPAHWQKAASETKHIIDYYLEMLAAKYNGDLRELRKRTGELVLPYIGMLSSEMERAHWVAEVARRVGLKEEPIWEELKKMNSLRPSTSAPTRAPAAVVASTRKRLLEERIVGLLAWKGSDFAKNISVSAEVFSPELQPILTAALGGEIEPHRDHLNRLALQAELLYNETSNDLEGELTSLCLSLNKEHSKVLFANIMDQVRQAELTNDHAKLTELTNQANELSRKLI